MTQRENSTNTRFEFPIPFDPFRPVLAVLERWKSIGAFALLAAAAGAAYAFLVLGNTYKSRIQLLKEPTPEYVDTDPEKPYVPVPLDDETFMSAAHAAQVYELAAKADNLKGKISPGEIRGSVSIEQVSGLGLFAVTTRTKHSAEAAYHIAYAYANAVIEHTANLRRMRARAKAELLGKELMMKQPAITAAERELLDFENETGVFDESAQVSTLFTRMSSLNLKLEETRTELDTATVLIKGYVRKLKGPRKLNELIARKAEELRLLRLDSTEEHPSVRRAIKELGDLEEQLAEAELAARSSGGGIGTLSNSNVDGQALQQYFDLENERKRLDDLYANYEKQKAETQAAIDALPEKVSKLAALENRVMMLRRTIAMTEARKTEAEFHSANAPGVVGIFEEISPADVSTSSRIKKSILLGLFGGLLGGFIATTWSVLREFFRRTVRTPIQAAIATKAAPVLRYDSETGPNGGTLRSFWLRNVARFAPEERRFLFAAVGDVEAEEAFWHDLFNSVGEGDQRVLFMDCSQEPLQLSHNNQPLLPYDYRKPAAVSSVSPHGYSLDAFKQLLLGLPDRHVLLMRWDSSNSASLIEFRELFDRYFFVTSTRDALLHDVEANARNYREVLGNSAGIILVERQRPAFAKRLMDIVQEWFIEFRGNRKTSPAPEPAI